MKIAILKGENHYCDDYDNFIAHSITTWTEVTEEEGALLGRYCRTTGLVLITQKDSKEVEDIIQSAGKWEHSRELAEKRRLQDEGLKKKKAAEKKEAYKKKLYEKLKKELNVNGS